MTSQRYIALVLIVLFTSLDAKTQSISRTVNLTGRVSELVAVTVPREAEIVRGQATFLSYGSGRAAVVTVSGSGNSGLSEIRIPIQLRSNVGYALFASINSSGVSSSKLAVTGMRPTGRFVTAEATERLNVAAAFDGRADAMWSQMMSPISNQFDTTPPNQFLSGPRISRAGTLNSPDNAVEITLALLVAPSAGNSTWSIELNISSSTALAL